MPDLYAVGTPRADDDFDFRDGPFPTLREATVIAGSPGEYVVVLPVPPAAKPYRLYRWDVMTAAWLSCIVDGGREPGAGDADYSPLEMTVGFWRQRMAGLSDAAPIKLLMSSTPDDNLDVHMDSLVPGYTASVPAGSPPDMLAIYVSIIDTQDKGEEGDDDGD